MPKILPLRDYDEHDVVNFIHGLEPYQQTPVQ